MLLNNASAVSTAATINSGLSSPTADVPDENSNKFITYLHQLAGSNELQVDVIMKDHCYARPWNWRPENIYVKPVKKLFFTKTPSSILRDAQNKKEFINVEECDPDPTAPSYDLSKIRTVMDEFQRVANFVKPEDTDDWEEKIDKILWSPVQNRIFSRVVRILNSERIARLSKSNTVHEPILRRTYIDMTAKRFRETLASANWDWRITQWLHSLLFDYLPQEYLAIYLDILQTLRQKIPQLIDKMIAVQPNINSKGSSVTWETLGPLLKKSWDPVAPILNSNKPKKLPGNPILLVTPNGISNNISSRQHKWIAQLGTLGTVITVNPHLGLNVNRITMITGMEQLVQATRAKIQDVRVDFPGRPIILVGFNSGAALACQICQMEHLTAVVCLGFPFNTVDGKRGTPDDTLLDIRCPVMFVIGQNSILARIDDVEDMRERMLVPTSLVVVGSADDHLCISTTKKISEKISQSMVDRCILDEICDFIGGILVQPHPLPLRSPSILNNYESRSRRNDARKRKNSTSSSMDSEPQSPGIKKLRPHSPQQGGLIAKNVTGITNMLPRGTLVTLTGTASTQTPRRRSRAGYTNQGFPDQLITSRLTPQQQTMDTSSGGITLNIGSFASLAPVGPIRFEPTSISLQTNQTGKSVNALKTSNAFIKVAGNNQMNVTGAPNVAKIKMIMPTKRVTQRTRNNYKNLNIADKSDDMNVTASPTSVRTNATTSTATDVKTNVVNPNTNALPSFHASKGSVSNSGTLTAKPVTSSSILFTPKSSSTITTTTPMTTTTMTTTTASTAPTKVADISVAGGSRKQHTIYRSYQQDQLSNSNSPSSLTGLPIQISPKTRSPKSRHAPKISLKTINKSLPQSKVQMPEKSLKICTGSTDTSLQFTPTCKTNLNTSLDDDLGNILDIPIIIAKDGDNLNNLERLSPLPQTAPITIQSHGKGLPIMNAVTNKVIFINSNNIVSTSEHQQSIQSQGLNQVISTCAQNSVTFARSLTTTSTQPTIKYTKIFLTKRNVQDDNSSPVVLTKTNKRTNKLVLLDSKNDVKYPQRTTKISPNYVAEALNTAKNENTSVKAAQYNSLN